MNQNAALRLAFLCYIPTAVTVAFALRDSASPAYQFTAPALAVLALGLTLVATTAAGGALSRKDPGATRRATRLTGRCLLGSAAVMAATVTASLVTAAAGL